MDIKALMESMNQSPSYGSQDYGKAFDDLSACAERGLPFPCGIIVRKGDIIDQVGFVYDGFTLKHGAEGGAVHRFDLQPDEKIVKVRGCSIPYCGSIIVKTLEFTTDKGRVFSVGTPNGKETKFEFAAPEGHAICALHGREARFVGAVGFCTRKNDLDLGGSIKDLGGFAGKLK